VLTKQHHNSFYQLINGLESVSEHYLRAQDDDYFNKTSEVLQLALKKQKSFVMVSHNAFYITQASVAPLSISTATQSPEDVYKSFEQIRKPVVDEDALVPKQVTSLQRLFGDSSNMESCDSDVLFNSNTRNYGNLRNIMLNFDDEQRQYIGNNLLLADPELEDYLIYKGLLEVQSKNETPRDETEKVHDTLSSEKIGGIETVNLGLKRSILSRLGKHYEIDILQAKVEYLSQKVEQSHLMRVFMCWLNQGAPLPQTTKAYNKILNSFNNSTMFRSLAERDILNDIYWTSSSSGKRAARQKE
jgi:hypothetical protein